MTLGDVLDFGPIAWLEEKGYAELAFLLVGLILGVVIMRFIGNRTAGHYKGQSDAYRAKHEQALADLSQRLDERDALSGDLHKSRGLIASQQLEIAELEARLGAAAPEGSLSVSGAVFHELVDGQIWSRPVATTDQSLIAQVSSIPILAVGNLKGGVGKTTCAGNLGAEFAAADGANKRVLFLDFDFQSSLSQLLNAISRSSNERRVEKLIDASRPVADRLLAAKPLSDPRLAKGCEYFDVDMQTTLAEDRAMLGWLMRQLRPDPGAEEQQTDIRLVLKRMLLDDAVQQRYDLIVIDLPPRNSMLSYNAICAATDLLMVAKPDAMSTDSIVRFATYLEGQRSLLFPNLRIAGIAGTMVNRQRAGWQASLEDAARESSRIWGGRPETIPLLPIIPERATIAKASGQEFAVFKDREVREAFAALAASLHLFADEPT